MPEAGPAAPGVVAIRSTPEGAESIRASVTWGDADFREGGFRPVLETTAHQRSADAADPPCGLEFAPPDDAPLTG